MFDPLLRQLIEAHTRLIPDALRARMLPMVCEQPADPEAKFLTARAGRIAAALQLDRPIMIPTVNVSAIIHTVAAFYGLVASDLLSRRGRMSIYRPRQIAMYLGKTLTPCSLPEIGRRFGGHHHTTVLQAVRTIEQVRKTDARLNDEIQLIIMHLAERFTLAATRRAA